MENLSLGSQQETLAYQVSSEIHYVSSAWLVVFSAALFFFYEFVQMNMFNAISPGLMRDFSINAEQLGNLSATYLYSTVLSLFPVGILLDRFSTRKLILAAMTVCICGTLSFALSTSLMMAQICRFIAGAGGAFCFLSTLMLASRWFPARKMAMVTGLIVTVAMLGGVAAQTPLTLLVGVVGWRHALLFDACLGILFMTIIWRFVRDYPPGHEQQMQASAHKLYSLGFWSSIRLALMNSQTWLSGIFTSLLNLPILLLGALWGALYLTQAHHFTAQQASYATSMVFVGTIIGSPIIGWCSDRLQMRRIPMLLGAASSLIFILLIMYWPNPTWINMLFFFLGLGIFSSAQILSYPLIVESNPEMLRGAAEGIGSAIIMAGGAVFQPVFGWLMDYGWNGRIINGEPFYLLQNYRLALWIIPIAFVISFIAALLVKETHCRPYEV